MFKNYLKIAFRNLYKNKLYSAINIFGLGAAIAVCITGYVNYHYSQSYDNFHKHRDNIYLVSSERTLNGVVRNLGSSPTPLVPQIKDDHSGVEAFTRMARSGAIVRHQDKVFQENVTYLDPSFFDVFSFRVVAGKRDALRDKKGMVITDEIAHKYFGDENPIGKVLSVSPDGEAIYRFEVQSVVAKPPTNSSIMLSICLPYQSQIEMLGFDLAAWNDWTSAAFIKIKDGIDKSQIEENLSDYIKITNEGNANYPVSGFSLISLSNLSKRTRTLSGSPFRGGFTTSQMFSPSVISLLVLMLACFNFVNTAVAFASKRLKEIGVRKVMGGKKIQLIKQFLGENFLLVFFAFFIGLALADPFLVFYDNLFPENNFVLKYFDNPELLVFLILLLLFTAIAAGAYPAFYVSNFNPVTIFSGKQKLSSSNKLIKVLLSLQFAISIAAIFSSIVLYKNSQFIENFDLGFNKDQVLVVPLHNPQNYQRLKNEILNNPIVEDVGATGHMVGRSWYGRDIEYDKTVRRINVLDIGENYLNSMDMKLIDGSDFSSRHGMEDASTVIINETMVKQLKMTSPIGKYLKFSSEVPQKEYRIRGVVKDFHLDGLWRPVESIIMKAVPEDEFRYMTVKFRLNNAKEISDYMQKTWKKLFPQYPYDGFYQTEIVAETALITESIRKLFLAVSFIVVITSGMGLFALVALNIVNRTKEIGIRKVLGANILNISYLISREFISILLVASVIGSIIGYFLLDALLSSVWSYYVDFGPIPFILAIVLMFVTAILTVGSQVVSVARENPIEAIRYE